MTRSTGSTTLPTVVNKFGEFKGLGGMPSKLVQRAFVALDVCYLPLSVLFLSLFFSFIRIFIYIWTH